MLIKAENAQKESVCNIVCCEENISDKNSSFLAKFWNGRMKFMDVPQVNLHCYQNCNTVDGLARKKIKKILMVDTTRTQYTGSNFGTSDSLRGEHFKFYVGVVNRKNHKITVHNTQFIHCNPVFNTSKPIQVKEENTKSYVEQMDELTSLFGSRNKRKAMQSRLRYAVGGSDVSEEVFDAIETSVTENVRNLADVQVAQVIPPQNLSATDAKNIYELDDIISPEEYVALDELAKPMAEATPVMVEMWKSECKYSCLVLHHFENKVAVNNIHKVKLLLYYDFIIQMLRIGYKDFRKKDPLALVPDPFKTRLLERFTLSHTNANGVPIKSMPQTMKDKAMAYAVVLALWIENFSVDMQFLVKDFKCGVPKATKIANALGCHISKQKMNGLPIKTVLLKLPLYNPCEKSFIRRGRK